ncbi:cysteinyl-tRNA synthetase [Gilbertella persicaria]|uniref:cysteinyl-tRNA synthetase n=1 Tax=Gilbertella persicaria TaxID=101096 RepID=UPI0022207F72|nr:cysteinyl-tRNA synthetase [Gilbertella persicaria]KAI8075340.1 cysteinyl-tRNA synthetase [Gilbertella persicaria]
MSTESTVKSRQQPPWHVPSAKTVPTLKLQNSLTKSKNEFVPRDGRRVTWYNCGPTVYDASHMGHARTYLSMDIIRRVLEDYFKYDVLFVQNITDIDDKIILRARQQYLFENLKKETTALDQTIIQQTEEAWLEYANAKLKKLNATLVSLATSNWTEFAQTMTPEEVAKAVVLDEKFKMIYTALDTSFAAIQQAKASLDKGDKSKEAVDTLLIASQDILSVYLDARKGNQVNDPKIFRELPAYWEAKYFEDMEALNVRAPDVQTRVSEYIPEIIDYVQKIIDNGYGYVADGSVYFDTSRYDGHHGHHYAKLEPWSKGDTALIEDGEGSLGSKLQGKKSPNDFALWKASKPGEPVWHSPWSEGRPGWHIECSVMASAVLGENMDIHSGGVDLAFPHHDNELAQAEAHFDCNQWVNYFLHAGHLHVEGQKMSKSLKNFITINEALKTYTARQLRIFFLLHQWDAKMDFKKSSMQETIQLEQIIKNFFDNTKALVYKVNHDGSRGATVLADGSITHRFRQDEKDLLALLQTKQDAVHAALCDSINTPVAMNEIMDTISATNKYMAAQGAKGVNTHLLTKVATWVTHMLKIFGVADQGIDIGFGAAVGHENSGNTEEVLMPYLRALSSFRDQVRIGARQKVEHTEFLRLCDSLRDNQMVDLGVSLDDQEDGTALVKLVSREELIQAREKKLAMAAEKEAKKAAAAAERERKRLEKLEKGKLAPQDMFKQSDEFSKFDDQGFPTHAKDGEELTKSRKKKLQKEYDNQKKLHEEYLKEVQK